jgi:predicted MPP superfamily phosphohydrolase
MILVFGFFLKVVKLYQRGCRNATDIAVQEIDIGFGHLPKAFDGYRILHLTDLHLDGGEPIEHIVCRRIENLQYDLCVLTGDYRERTHGSFKAMLKPMEKIAKAIRAKDGILAVLGNHDSYLMVDYLEDMGIQVLANETTVIQRGRTRMAVTGIDDPNYYYTDQAIRVLEESEEGFKVVLVHTPELFDIAADNRYSLYLCGHTHGGQICLPGGIPLITHLCHGRQFHRGLWHHADMKGYTSQGTGTVALPVRLNSQSEIACITLRRSEFRKGKHKDRLAVLPNP